MLIGQDQIPAFFLKIVAEILDEPLSKIFNRTISENKFGEGAKKSGATLKGIFEKALSGGKKKKKDKKE